MRGSILTHNTKRPLRRMAIPAAIAGVLLAGAAFAQQIPDPPKAGGWLRQIPLEQQSDAIDRQLRGFDMAMFEVNYRYIEMYFGAMEGNWDYALYTGEKIAWALMNGYQRRPKRQANTEKLFFKGAYPRVLEAIRRKDLAQFKKSFDEMRMTCNACHTAEKVPFIHVGIPSVKQTPLVND